MNTRITPKALKKFIRPNKPLTVALLQAMQERFDIQVDGSEFGSVAHPIDGHEMDYQRWLKRYAPHAASAPLAKHHIRAWEWAESIEANNPPPALIECWFRGGGKSTTMELI